MFVGKYNEKEEELDWSCGERLLKIVLEGRMRTWGRAKIDMIDNLMERMHAGEIKRRA